MTARDYSTDLGSVPLLGGKRALGNPGSNERDIDQDERPHQTGSIGAPPHPLGQQETSQIPYEDARSSAPKLEAYLLEMILHRG